VNQLIQVLKKLKDPLENHYKQEVQKQKLALQHILMTISQTTTKYSKFYYSRVLELEFYQIFNQLDQLNLIN